MQPGMIACCSPICSPRGVLTRVEYQYPEKCQCQPLTRPRTALSVHWPRTTHGLGRLSHCSRDPKQFATKHGLPQLAGRGRAELHVEPTSGASQSLRDMTRKENNVPEWILRMSNHGSGERESCRTSNIVLCSTNCVRTKGCFEATSIHCG